MTVGHQGNGGKSVEKPALCQGAVWPDQLLRNRMQRSTRCALLRHPWLGLHAGISLSPTSAVNVPAPHWVLALNLMSMVDQLSAPFAAISRHDFLESSCQEIEGARRTSVHLLVIFACQTHIYRAIVSARGQKDCYSPV